MRASSCTHNRFKSVPAIEGTTSIYFTGDSGLGLRYRWGITGKVEGMVDAGLKPESLENIRLRIFDPIWLA